MHAQQIVSQLLDWRVAEQHKWSAPELDGYFRETPLQSFARAYVEWHIRPAPVIDGQFQRHERFCVGFRRDVRLCAVSRYGLTLHDPGAILPAYGTREYILSHQRLDGMQDLGLLIAHRVSVE